MLFLHRQRGVPTITNDVDKQSVGTSRLMVGIYMMLSQIVKGPALDACTRASSPMVISKKVAATFAFS